MVEKDRKELNKRFQRVYELLEQRGEIVNNHPDKSKSAFAEKLLGSKQYGHIISQFLNGKRYIAYKHARKVCQLYGINPSYMIDGIGTPFDDFVRPESTGVTIEKNNHQILYTNVKTLANQGIGLGSFNYEKSRFFSLPDLDNRDLVAFDVEGHSMEPLISKGDMVVCKPIEDINDVKDKEIYAVRLNGQVWIKHVKKINGKSGRVTHLDLISANYLEHPPFREEVNGTIKFYKVVRKITTF